MSKCIFPYRWNLTDGYPAKGIAKNGLNVFGTFICGGGSTMGYKLAGFNHLGGVEIDPHVADVYKANHKPKFLFVEDIRAFNERQDLPAELYSLDILDGSPPCSTFSMAGSREKAWGKEKQFREGQTVQTLDDLVFVYCETIKKLRPKVFLLENVKGIIQGNAKAYSKQIVRTMTEAGYNVQVFMLNAASMGVPQKRERVFFIGHRKELGFSKLKLGFNERPVLFGEIYDKSNLDESLRDCEKKLWKFVDIKDKSLSQAHVRSGGKGSYFNHTILNFSRVMSTISGNAGGQDVVFELKRNPTDLEFKLGGTYPLDYNFKTIEPKYLIGMSVPPVMIAQIAWQIAIQWFKVSQL